MKNTGAKRVKVGAGGALSRLYRQLTKPSRNAGKGMYNTLKNIGAGKRNKPGAKRLKAK